MEVNSRGEYFETRFVHDERREKLWQVLSESVFQQWISPQSWPAFFAADDQVSPAGLRFSDSHVLDVALESDGQADAAPRQSTALEPFFLSKRKTNPGGAALGLQPTERE
jgi:hypothetical protein